MSFNSIITSGTGTNQSFAKVLEGISTQEKINIVTRSNLTEVQKMGVLATAGLSAEELKNVASTTALSATQTTATATTTGLGTALRGLWATMLANPLLMVGMAVTAGITAWNAYKQSVEKTRQATSDTAQIYSDTSSSIEEYANKYKALYDELTNANATEERQKEIKSDLLSLQQELNDKYGEEYGKLNLVTDAYKDQTDAILSRNKAAAQSFLNENTSGINDAETQMTKQRTYTLANAVSTRTDFGKEILDYVNSHKELGISADANVSGGVSTGTFTLKIETDASDANKTINDFMTYVNSLKEKYGEDNSGIDDVIGVSSDALQKSKEILDNYEEIYNQALTAQISSNDELSEGFNKAKNAVQTYNDALASGDESKILSARNDLNSVKSSIDLTSEDWKKYGSLLTDVFDQADTGLYDFRDDLNTTTNNLNSFAKILKDKDLSETDLLAMADDDNPDYFDRLVEAGKEYGLTVEQVIDELIKMGIVQEDVAKSGEDAFTPLSKQDLITNINSLSEGFESLDKIMNSMSGDDVFDYSLLDDSKFKEAFSNLNDGGKAYENFIEAVSNSPKDVNTAQSAFNDLVTTWIDGSGVLDGLTEDNVNLATAMLQNMGIANAEEVVTSRLAIAQEHLAAQKAYTAAVSDELTNATANEIPGIIDEATNSDIAKVALAGLVLEKQFFNGNSLDTSGDIENIISLIGVIGTANNALKALNTLKAGGDVGGNIGGKEGYDAIVKAAQQEVDDAIKAASEYKGQGSKTNTSYTGGVKTAKTNAGSDKKTKEETTKDIDWIDRQLKLLEDKRSELLNKASSTYIDYLGLTENEFNRAKELFNSNISPMSDGANELLDIADKAGISIGELFSLIQNGNVGESKENYLAQVLEADKTMLDQYAQAVAQYQSEYDKSISSVSPQYKAKIESGDMSVDTLSSKEAESVQTAMDAYDKLQSVKSKQYEMQKTYLDDIMAKYDNISVVIENENKQLENSASLIKAQMEYLETSGEIVGASYYVRLIDNADSQISNTRKSISNMRAELRDLLVNGVDKNSEEYVNLKSEISDAEENIYSLKKAQEEYNNQLLQMPIDNLSTIVSMYKDINTTIENWGNEVEASGKKLDSGYYQTLISNGATVIDQYKKQARLIKDVMDEYETGSDNWQELYSQLQSINSEMSSMIGNLQKWNEELLNMPLQSIESYSDSLQKVITGLTNVQDKYNTVITAVTSAIQKQIDVLEDQQEVETDKQQAEIDALNDKLDLLEKQNEKLKLQTALERALYDLERANTQKTSAVIRDGELIYEANVDDLRNAQEAIADAQYDIEKYNLDQQIEAAENALDALNDKYSEQIDALQGISDKWTEISEKITEAANAATASSILGEGWKQKIVSGNDADLYNMFSSLYQTNAKQLAEYQEQAETTDNIYSLLEDYIDSYKDGTITYEQAMSGINGLLAQMNDSMSAMDNLQNIYDYLATTNDTDATADSILKGIQSGLSTTADKLVKSLEQYNKNSGMISEYTSSWQQLTSNVEKMLDVLKEVRDNLRNASDDDDDDDDSSKKSKSKGWDDSDAGNGPGIGLSYKDGISNGLVGSSSTSDKEAKLKLLGLKELDPDELPAVLHMNEAVFNPDQQQKLLDNFAAAYSFQPYTTDYGNMLNDIGNSSSGSSVIHISNNGDLSFPNVRNIDDAIEEYATLQEQAILQAISKIK
ncbi:hypothetical protein AALB39_04590 [Lachnospiraceae bacterium 54-53]